MADRYRYRTLDSYRFFAALAVVFGHYCAHFSPFLGVPVDVADRLALVDFFFVLSGFVLMHAYGSRIAGAHDYLVFLKRRVARLYPLHALTTLAFLAIALAVTVLAIPVRQPSTFDLGLTWPNLLLVHAWGFMAHEGFNFPSWSLSAEFFVYLTFPVLAWFVGRVGSVWALVAAALIAVGLEALREASGMRALAEATYDGGALRALPSFLAGMAVNALLEGVRPIAVPWAAPNGLALVLVASMAMGAPSGLAPTFFPLLIALVALADRSGAPTVLRRPALVALGNASFGIFILHTLFAVAMVGVVRRFGLTSPVGLVAAAVAGTALTVVVALVTHHRFETPVRLYLERPVRTLLRPLGHLARTPTGRVAGIAILCAAGVAAALYGGALVT